MDVEDRGDLLARFGDHLLAQLGDRGDRRRHRLVKPADLVGRAPRRDVALGNEQILSVQHDRRADHYARGNAYALFDLHENSLLVANC